MSTELHTQIRAYGAQLMDDQPPITEAEVLALVASVRELSVVGRPVRAKPRPWIAVAAAAVTLVVGGLIAWLAPQSDPDANPADTMVSTTAPEVTIVSTTSPEVTTTSPEDCRDCDPETPVGLIPLGDLDDDVLRPLDQIQLGDIIVPTAPTGWALDPEVYMDQDQSAFVVTVWNPDASRAFEIWAAPACEPTATHCPIFSYGSIPWPLTDPGVFSETIDRRGAMLTAVIGDHVVVVVPDSQDSFRLSSNMELITSLRAVAPDELPLKVIRTVRFISPDPAAVEAALAPFQPLDEVQVMTPGSGGPIPRWRVGAGRHILALDNPHGYLDAWTHLFDPSREDAYSCIFVEGAGALISLSPGGDAWGGTWCAPGVDPAPGVPFFYADQGLDHVVILLKGGPDTIAFIVEEQDGRRVGLVAVSGLAFYWSGNRNGCGSTPSELTAVEADGSIHTVSPWWCS